MRKTGNISKLRVGEVATKIIYTHGQKRKITVKRIKSSGFPQYKIISNESA